MLDKDKLARLNTLAKQKKADNISKKELEELQMLRQEYLKNFKNSFKKQIENTTVIDPAGNDVTPQKVKNIQNKQK